jgi:DNA-binding PadR family transcriptional regulator
MRCFANELLTQDTRLGKIACPDFLLLGTHERPTQIDLRSPQWSLYLKGAPPEHELLDVNELIGEMLVLLRSEANRYSIDVRTDLASELPAVTADRVQLQQVLMNLMLNGIEAMKDTGGEHTIETELVQDGQLLISVSDTGVGLPAGKTDQIFNAFITTKPQGSGMLGDQPLHNRITWWSRDVSVHPACRGGKVITLGYLTRAPHFHLLPKSLSFPPKNALDKYLYIDRYILDMTESQVQSFLPLKTHWFHIMLSLAGEEQHGYGIMQEVLERTTGKVRLWPATLYGSIKRLIEEDLIEESSARPAPQFDDARRRYYRLTTLGRRVLDAECDRLQELVQAIQAKRTMATERG